jgi:hypothetical protein
MTRCLLLCLTFVGCRYLGPATPEVNPERPALLSGDNSADPSRQPRQLPGRPCLIECAPGYRCNRDAVCEPDLSAPRRDAGLSWMP